MCDKCEAMAERHRASSALLDACRGLMILTTIKDAFPLSRKVPDDLLQLASRLSR